MSDSVECNRVNRHHPHRMIGWVIVQWRGISDQFQLAGNLARLFATVDIELAVDALRLRLDGIDGNNQFPGYLRVGATGGEQAQHTSFLRAQWLERHSRRGW